MMMMPKSALREEEEPSWKLDGSAATLKRSNSKELDIDFREDRKLDGFTPIYKRSNSMDSPVDFPNDRKLNGSAAALKRRASMDRLIVFDKDRGPRESSKFTSEDPRDQAIKKK